MSDWLTLGLDRANLALTCIFTVEMCLKIGGYGPKKYASDLFNVFDALIVISSLVELILVATTDGSDGGKMSVLRTLRLMRIARTLKLVKGASVLRAVLETALGSLMAVANFAMLLLVRRLPWRLFIASHDLHMGL